ncbi:MAG: GNAT family N-acetyltransferase [Planctomycetia bacterium]|nr:GNAT family N-acetyltransferase [Planctomycetia bacterium]
MTKQLDLKEIDNNNQDIYDFLSQVYEAEFAPLTHTEPDCRGHYSIASPCPAPNRRGWIAYQNSKPIGFIIVEKKSKFWDVSEFFILPDFRKNGYGFELASTVFQMIPTDWQIRQLLTANQATSFWQKVLQKMDVPFTQTIQTDPDWGMVVSQRFSTKNGK